MNVGFSAADSNSIRAPAQQCGPGDGSISSRGMVQGRESVRTIRAVRKSCQEKSDGISTFFLNRAGFFAGGGGELLKLQ